jgi:ABC-type lipoprotein export system ATPase subunit
MELPDNNYYNNIIKENVSVSKELTTNEIYSKLMEYDMKKYFVNENFNVKDLLNKKMQELSGGQRQKILILREILSPKDILFFDEPTSSLDKKSISELKKIILSLKKNRIILIITHDDYFDNIADEEIKLV